MRQKRSVKILSRVFIAICLVVALAPIYWMLNTSFKGQAEIYSRIPTMFPNMPTLESYETLFTKTAFLNGMKNSLLVAVFVSAFSIVVAYPAAYTLARMKFKGKKFFSKTILFTYLHLLFLM